MVYVVIECNSSNSRNQTSYLSELKGLDKLVLDPDRGSAPTRNYFYAVL